MDWTQVTSSHLEAVAYDEQSMTLSVRFRSGHTYTYAGVPQSKVHQLLNADSIGKMFDRTIRGQHGHSYMGRHR